MLGTFYDGDIGSGRKVLSSVSTIYMGESMIDTPTSAEFGWGAPSFKEQFPTLSDEVATRFDEDNKAMIRLRIRGYMTDGERDNVMKKITKAIERELRHV